MARQGDLLASGHMAKAVATTAFTSSRGQASAVQSWMPNLNFLLLHRQAASSARQPKDAASPRMLLRHILWIATSVQWFLVCLWRISTYSTVGDLNGIMLGKASGREKGDGDRNNDLHGSGGSIDM